MYYKDCEYVDINLTDYDVECFKKAKRGIVTCRKHADEVQIRWKELKDVLYNNARKMCRR